MRQMKTQFLTLALATFVATVSADEINMAGYTNGAFNGVPAANQGNGLQMAQLVALAYTNSTFSGTTAGGFLAFGGNPMPVGIQNINNLGSFSLANSLATYTGNSFTLRTTFTLPFGINGGGSSLYSASLNGSVNTLGNGGVFIDFNNTPQLFAFSSSPSTGSFLFAVNDLSINPGQVGDVTGQITSGNQTTPSTNVPDSGSTLVLLGGAWVTVALFSRKFVRFG